MYTMILSYSWFLLNNVYKLLTSKEIDTKTLETLSENFIEVTYIEIKPHEKLPLPDLEKYKNYLESLNYFAKKGNKEKEIEFNIDLQSIPRIDLSKRSLKFAKLSGIFLPYAFLKNANLQSANLVLANLQSANLVLANLQSADLWRANLQSANLVLANLQSANLELANLQSADLWHANLQSADLKNANLQSADLELANLQSADLWHANLQSANLELANLQSTDLWHANLQSADLKNANLQSAFLYKTMLYGIKYYKGAEYKNTLVIKPDWSKLKNLKDDKFDLEEAKRFFSQPQFQDFKGWFESIKEESLKNKDLEKNIIFFLKDVLRDKEIDEKVHQKAWLTVVRFVKYWKKEKPELLKYFRLIGNLETYNKKYSTKGLYLTEEEIKLIKF